MSLASLALRLAIVEALAPAAQVAAASPVWPTTAKHRVYDSFAAMRAPTENPKDRLVAIAVYLVDQKGDPRGESYGYDAPDVTSTIAIECDITIVSGAGVDAGEAVVQSDPAAEAALDIVTAQVIYALERGPTGALYREIRTALKGAEEIPMRDETTGARYTRRTMRLTIAHPGDDWSTWAPGELPWPAKAVADALPAGSYGAAILETVRAWLGDPSAPPTLDGIDIGLALGRVPDDLADADVVASAATD